MAESGGKRWRAPEVSSRARTLGAAAGVVVTAMAWGQTTHISFEGSIDEGQSWSSNLAPPPGGVVFVRMRIHLEGATAVGLAGLMCQPVVTGWSSGDLGGPDVLQPFTFPGLDAQGNPTNEGVFNGNAVRSLPQSNTGRMFPYGAIGQGVDSDSGVLTGHVGPNDQLWFAGSRATLPGAEPQYGIAIGQLPVSLASTNFSFALNTVVFRFAVQTNSFNCLRTVSLANLRDNRVRWYTNYSGTSTFDSPNVVVHELDIITFPSPGTISLMAVAGLACARRRRRVGLRVAEQLGDSRTLGAGA